MSEGGTYDLAIVGSGFGGSLLAMIARRIGLSVLLLERGTHPRFAMGESTSPLTNLLIEELAHRYDLPRLLPLTTYGAWQKAYPEIRCGLKRGFTYYAHEAGKPYEVLADRSNQLLVAASPRDEIADTHWLRADVDAFLVREATVTGVEYHDNVQLEAPKFDADGNSTLTGSVAGEPLHVKARFLIDATGPRGFLSRALNIPEVPFDDYPGTQALYTHFSEVARCDEMTEYRTPGIPPYPPDAAALHHVFDGGWMWVLRFDDGVTSAGIAVTDARADKLRLAEGAPAWERFLDRFPTIRAQFKDAVPARPFTYQSRLAYRSSKIAGNGWAMLPSAAAFIDPLFSTGFPLTLLGIERIAQILSECWSDGNALHERFAAYELQTFAEADATADYIAGCYAAFGDFPTFAAQSMFYFAAASYSEMARRLNRTDLTRGFLMAAHPAFGAAMRVCSQHVRAQKGRWNAASRDSFARQLAEGIDCLNVAGLADVGKGNWYPVDLADVVQGAEKLGLTANEMREELAWADWL